MFRRHYRSLFIVALSVGGALGAYQLAAAEPETWADPHLKVTRGLALWLDASVEKGARRALGKRQPRRSKLNAWHDASGHGRHFVQSEESAQPLLRIDDIQAGVRFDGLSTSLAADALGLALRELTVVVVAAPFVNDGNFRAFLAFNGQGANDYVSGLNLDLGPAEPSTKFEVINAEGAGFSGGTNLKQGATPFAQLHRMCLTSVIGQGGTALFVNGVPAGRRDRAESMLRIDRATVGARFYNNGGPPDTRGFLAGEIAEVLIYDRALNDQERKQVDEYLAAKYGELRNVPLPPELVGARPIARVAQPSKVQMLAPGFRAHQLPVELSNINNVRYRHDGKLVAMAYDGRIFLLSDTDGDNIEDRADLFWDRPGITSPIGIALTPPGYAPGQGVFVAAREQVVLVADRDGDDRGDKALVVAEGWKPLEHSVDTMGIALGPDHSVYFGLGTENYTNGYLLDADGLPRYQTQSDRGAIFRVSPDWSTRERICSGVRFSVALAFNRQGDLFCTDQEGATWLPNGNPFDELLHIQPGRHYGFPPRHPRHLPDVVDEPSVYDYGPQHQSICGLCFNEAQTGGKSFGPDWWRSNALACGYSRGKLYRTTLVKTPRGYVAEGTVLGCLDMLTVDTCLSPSGDLVVAAHSGGPDWGSGPGGKGALYKITYVDREVPQPVRAFAASPHEVQVVFDRPLEPEAFKQLSEQLLIEYGPQVRAGDRFESLWPGYAVVEAQNRSPRHLLPVLGATLTADRRSLVLTTDAHPQAESYAVLMSAPRQWATAPPAIGLAQLPIVELTYNLGGVQAIWESAVSAENWTRWLPHVEPETARGLLAGCITAEGLATISKQAGKLTLKTQLDLRQMLQPAVQSGSKLDYEPSQEKVTVTLEADIPFSARIGDRAQASAETAKSRHVVTWTDTATAKAWLAIEITASKTDAPLNFSASWHTDQDLRERPFAPRRFWLPWARPTVQPASPQSLAPAELAGGDWQRGRNVFFSEQAQCGKCHALRGKGGWIGPDLSNLVHRDYASVLRDITNPSFAINPDHLAYNLVLDDGRTLTGRVQPRGNQLVVGDIKGVETLVARENVESMSPARVSIMPEGLPKALGELAMRDLLTFLLTAEPGQLEPAPIERPGAPALRSRAEVGAILKHAQPVDVEQLKPLKILLVAGPKDHDVNEHDYPQWQSRWSRLLPLAPKVRVATADVWPSREQLETADIVAFFSANLGWTPERAKELDAYLERGGGLIYLHFAVNGQRAPEELAQRIGLAWRDGSSFRHGELDLQFRRETQHPILTDFPLTSRFIDESYWNLTGDVSKINVLATQVEEGEARPLVWTCDSDRGRVFCSILGHYSWTFDDPLFRTLVLRGMAWTARQPIDRFNDLITIGARVAPAGQ